jgi:hypothetical protein
MVPQDNRRLGREREVRLLLVLVDLELVVEELEKELLRRPFG